MQKRSEDDRVKIALLNQKIDFLTSEISDLQKHIDSLRADIRSDFVHMSEFDPVRKVVYGMIGLILTSVLAAVVALVLKS